MAVRTLLLTILLVCAFPAVSGDKHSPAESATERRIDSLLSIMTVQEKVGQLVQYSAKMADEKDGRHLAEDQAALIRQGRVGSLLNTVGSVANRRIQELAVTQSRLKIPLLFGLDVIHGFRTIFPIPLGEAATWEPDLVRRAARVAAIEASAAGIHWTFAPMVDIARDPRWGRIAEGSGEDPYLGSLMAAARVRGFQGDDLTRDDAILACVKHFAAYGGAEGGRDYNTVDVSERTLRETYLPPFEEAVKAGAATLMCSFNEIAGIPNSGNRLVLTDILRGEWKFDGFVVSDWGSIGEMQQHGFSASLSEAAAQGLLAGVDMDMESKAYDQHLADLVMSGKIPLNVLDESVRRVLRVKFRLGLFENPHRGTSPVRERNAMLGPEHRTLAREVARRSMVLLKNDTMVLPLRRDLKKIAVIGPLATSRLDLLGCWDAQGDSTDVVQILTGIREAAGVQSEVVYAKGCNILGTDKSGFAEAIKAASGASVAILVIGESSDMSGEARSRATLTVPGVQEDLVEAVRATGTPVVVVLLNGRPLTIPRLQVSAAAILEAWYPGVEGGHAVADVLFGAYNPSGKLPATFPLAVGQIPLYYNHKNSGRPENPSDRYTSKYIDMSSQPLYPFGYGLSYTRFEYSSIALSATTIRPDGSLTASVTVANTGERPGEEVVQLYIRDRVASVTRPVRELREFRKILLNPGQKQRVDFVLGPENLAMYSQSMKRVVEPGEFDVLVGGNSRDVISASFTVANP
jgi:beta-glucosidase